MRCLLLIMVLMLAGLGTGFAQESELSDQAPADVQATMRTGGISLRFGELPIGPAQQKVLLHIYVVPSSQTAVGGKTPLRREDILVGTSIQRSPFYVDMLVREKGILKRLNSVTFAEDGKVAETQIRWLEPKLRRGPVLLMRFGVGDSGEWQVFAFPDGVEKAAIHQTFGYGGDQSGGSKLDFDAVNSLGKMTVLEDWSDGNKEGLKRYPWDGVEFADRSCPYFVIAASVQTRAEAEAFVQHHKGLEDSEIRPSGHYPKLTPGYFVVIAWRLTSLKDAEDYARELRKEGTDCYIKRAF